jgi:hypothetical protein
MLYHGTYAQIVRESRKRSLPCSRRHRLDNNSGLCSGKEQTNGGREQFEEDASKEQRLHAWRRGLEPGQTKHSNARAREKKERKRRRTTTATRPLAAVWRRFTKLVRVRAFERRGENRRDQAPLGSNESRLGQAPGPWRYRAGIGPAILGP